MHLNEPILQEFDHEMAGLRKVLERVEETKFGWKPHEKSLSYGQLASHLADLAGWGHAILGMDVFEMKSGQAPFAATTNAELLQKFDENVAGTRGLLKKASNESLMATWTMKMDGMTLIELPRIAVVRTWMLNHVIHHRGQLTVYLRLNGAPVPALYGPSADEQF